MLLSLIIFLQKTDFFGIPVQFIRRLQIYRNPLQGRMINDPYHSFSPDTALSDLFVTVLVAGERIFTVVHMNRPQTAQPDHAVKLLQHTIQVVDNIVSRIVHMTRIKTYSHMLLQLYTIKDRTSILSDEIIQETVWGVADETLFTQVLRSLDEHAAAGEPAFEMVMTTSNHRPFTFPEGRVDSEQGTREGAVLYTDWAIHDFLERAKAKPWFENTVFVIVADHQAGVAGKSALPVDKYRIPCLVYAPGLVGPGSTDRLVSQMDLGPTLLGMLGLSYRTSWLGRDAFQTPEKDDRAFISTYQSLGLVKGDDLVVLTPDKAVAADRIDDWETSDYTKEDVPTNLGKEAISWYQEASDLFKNGLLKNR